MRVREAAIAVMLVTFCCGNAAAEVRLVSGVAQGLDLTVIAGRHGLWALVGVADAAVLNASGDVTGDSFPAWDRTARELVAAWLRPLDGTLQLAVASGGSWRARLAVPAPSCTRVAAVHAVGHGNWLAFVDAGERGATGSWLLWFRLDGEVLRQEDGVFIASGYVLGSAVIADGLVAIQTEEGTDAISVRAWRVSPVPILDPLRQTTIDNGWPAGSAETHGGTVAEALDVRARDVVGCDDHSMVVTWWSGSRELSFVQLAEDGAMLPVRTLSADHGPIHSQRLVQDALREAACGQ